MLQVLKYIYLHSLSILNYNPSDNNFPYGCIRTQTTNMDNCLSLRAIYKSKSIYFGLTTLICRRILILVTYLLNL